MSDKATIDALGWWVSRLSARVKALEEARAHAPQCPAWKLDHFGECACGPEPVPKSGNRPTPHPEEGRCPDTLAEQRCYLWEGHPDQHVTFPTVLKWGWVDVEPESECCGRGPACAACDPEPVPEWRRLVDAAWHPGNMPSRSDALGVVLDELSRLALSKSDSPPIGCLARIVAVCEASQDDEGWRALPSTDALLGDEPPLFTAWEATRALVLGSDDDTLDGYCWRILGCYAAAWLLSLTKATP